MKIFNMKGWSNPETVALTDWPDITDKDIYNFMVYKCQKSVDMEKKNARRQLKAHVFYDDGHVHSVRLVCVGDVNNTKQPHLHMNFCIHYALVCAVSGR